MSVICGSPAQLSRDLFKKISVYRHKVFIEKLGWRLKGINGMELDQFDRPDTIYVVSVDDRQRIQGCARLLPTDRPYLLGEVFPQLMGGQAIPCSPDIWELSRFAAVDINTPLGTASPQAPSPVAMDLLRESIQYAVSHGARRLITVSPIGIERLLRRIPVHAHRAGSPMVIDGHPVFACWIEIE